MNIVLIGFMGTGKTAVGKRLAALLHKKFYDSDDEIEKVTGMTITQLFNKFGEIRFRSEEKLVVNRLAQKENCVIATGGGVVLEQANLDALSANGVLICLSAQPEVIYERVKRRNNRPLLMKGDLYQNIIELSKEREELYQTADLYVDTSGLDFQEIIDRIIDYLKERGQMPQLG